MSQAEAVYEQLQQFKHASQIKSVTANGRQRLDTLMPVLLSLLVKEKIHRR